MRNPVAITPPRDRFPARGCLLLAAILIAVLGLPGTADARAKRKPAPIDPPVAAIAVVPAKATTASLRAANDSVGPKALVEVPTGSIRGLATVGKAPSAATAEVGPEVLPSVSPQRPRDWYPESHSYLRPYHYKWRYWTPG